MGRVEILNLFGVHVELFQLGVYPLVLDKIYERIKLERLLDEFNDLVEVLYGIDQCLQDVRRRKEHPLLRLHCKNFFSDLHAVLFWHAIVEYDRVKWRLHYLLVAGRLVLFELLIKRLQTLFAIIGNNDIMVPVLQRKLVLHGYIGLIFGYQYLHVLKNYPSHRILARACLGSYIQL